MSNPFSISPPIKTINILRLFKFLIATSPQIRARGFARGSTTLQMSFSPLLLHIWTQYVQKKLYTDSNNYPSKLQKKNVSGFSAFKEQSVWYADTGIDCCFSPLEINDQASHNTVSMQASLSVLYHDVLMWCTES